MKNDNPKLKIIKEIAEKLLELLEVKVSSLVVKEENEMINIQLETEEPGVLIGYHGKALQSLQLLIALMSFKKLGEWTRVVVNVGDYREKREESLTRMAQSLAQRVKFSGLVQSLPPMSSAERRVIHLALADDVDVETVSEGEGQERHVVIKPKK